MQYHSRKFGFGDAILLHLEEEKSMLLNAKTDNNGYFFTTVMQL